MNGSSGILSGKEFEEILLTIRKRQTGAPLYRTLVFDLNTARSNVPFDLAGGYMEVIDATDSSAFMDVRFNEIQHDTVRVRNGDSVVTPFYRVFLTNTAQAKSITIAVSLSYELWRVIRSQQVLIGGSITAKEQWLQDIQDGVAYQGAHFQGAGGAGFGATGQLLNPAGSGVNLFMKMASLSVITNAASVRIYMGSRATEVAGGAENNALNLSTFVEGQSQQGRFFTSATNLTLSQVLFTGATPAGPFTIVFPLQSHQEWIAIIPPNNGVVWTSEVLNVETGLSCAWSERPQ